MKCPFCGGDGSIYGNVELKNLKPKCRDCGRGPKGKYETYSDAVASWDAWSEINRKADAFNNTLHIGDWVYFINRKAPMHLAFGRIINLSAVQATISTSENSRGFVCVPYGWVVVQRL